MSIAKVIRNYSLRHYKFIVLSLVIVAADVITTLVPPIMLKYIVDSIIGSGDLSLLLMWALLYALAYVAYGSCEFLKSVILIRISQGICKDLRLSLYEKVKKMDYEVLSSYDIGTVESYFNNDVNTINALVSDGVISMLIDIFKMFGVFISIFFFSVGIGFVVLAVAPFIAVFVYFVRKNMYKSQLRSKRLESDVNKQVLESIENIEAVQTYDAYDFIEGEYHKTLIGHFDAQQISYFYNSVFSPVMQVLQYGATAAIIIISVWDPSVFGITIGTFLSLANLLSALFTPMENIGMELQTLQESVASIHRINVFMSKKDANQEDGPKNLVLGKGPYVLEFSHVSYSYRSDEKVIADFSLRLSGNQKLTLKGRSGVGKSTLFKLGYGLLKPAGGQVTINGLEAFRLSDETRQKVFGIVYQDPFFSGGSIREELTLGDFSFADSQIREALESIGLKRVGALDVPLKESDYSSGELVLFNISRVVLRHPPIIFLDEMNARIDPQTASKIIGLLNKYASDSMILSISHYGTELAGAKELVLDATNGI